MQKVGSKHLLLILIQVGLLLLSSFNRNKDFESDLEFWLNKAIQSAKSENSLIFSYPNSVEGYERTGKSFGERQLVVFNDVILRNTVGVENVFPQFQNCILETIYFNRRSKLVLSKYIQQPFIGRYVFVSAIDSNSISGIFAENKGIIGVVSFKIPISFICNDQEWLYVNIEINGGRNFSSWNEGYLFVKSNNGFVLNESKKW